MPTEANDRWYEIKECLLKSQPSLRGERGMSQENRLIRIDEVLEIVGVSKSVLYEMIGRGQFPRPVRISLRAVRWRQQDLDEWLDSLQPATAENWH